MQHSSFWNSWSDSTKFPSLDGSIEADVAIIGAGITGITLAHLLADSGYQVAVLEARKTGGGTTAHSTGNLYSTIDQHLFSLKDKYDLRMVKKIVSARKEAIQFIENTISKYSIDCDFARRDWFLYSTGSSSDLIVEKEYQTALEAGLPATADDDSEIPFNISAGMKLKGQAQFNPLRYVQGLAGICQGPNVRIYENTRVESLSEHENEVYLLSEGGGQVKADYAVHATHTPKGKMIPIHPYLGPYREYGVTASLKSGTYPEGIFWGYHNHSDKYSTRSCTRNGKKVIMAIGRQHKVGQSDNNRLQIKYIKAFLNESFDIDEFLHFWGGQNYKPADMLPYIGRKREGSRIFIATGFSTDGLVYGTLSGMIISDLIKSSDNPYADIFRPYRKQPLKSARKFIGENLEVSLQYLKKLPFYAVDDDFEAIRKGEGEIINRNGHKIAAYKTAAGELELHSAVCTHMGCIVQWNNAEKTWDCPCHASRFETDGSVIEGPALHPLKQLKHEVEKTGRQ